MGIFKTSIKVTNNIKHVALRKCVDSLRTADYSNSTFTEYSSAQKKFEVTYGCTQPLSCGHVNMTATITDVGTRRVNNYSVSAFDEYGTYSSKVRRHLWSDNQDILMKI